MPVFYWIDDENDFAKYVGQRVEIVGELSSDLDKGEIEIMHQGEFTDIEFEVNGREAKARIPRAWLGPATSAKDAEFDVAEFAGAYAILGAQRATKILGIFARLDKRDGKPQYLKHLPRIETYLSRNLAHPALSRLRGWYEAHLPRIDPVP